MNPEKPTANPKSSNSSNSYPFIASSPKGLFITIRVQPRASKNKVDGVQGGVLKIRLTAPPVEGEANRAIIDFLSRVLELKKSAFSIDTGLRSREKRVRVEDVTREWLEEAFSKIFAGKD
jgi:uncharacterized protein